MNMPQMASDITVVPVMVNYERNFEMKNLATEMVSSEASLLTKADLIKRFGSLRPDQMGDTFVKFLEPILLKKFLAQSGTEKLTRKIIDKAAFDLSSELYKR